ncbi:MAG: mechanosensitive ion channel [Candidatus Rokubacteria bacterium]|nr:mechanosensitive ion channel [Candidatus Rokubacteria bacterium]
MWQFFWPGLAFVAATVVALLLRALLLSAIRRWARAPNGWASLAQAIRLPSVLWSIVLGLWVAIEVASETAGMPRRLGQPLGVILEVAIILSVTITVAGIVSTLIERASERRALGGPVTGLGQTVARGVVFIVGGLVLLAALGIQITPLLTALGVGGLAVALALQDTLSNLFAGAHLLADKPIRVGDYVKIAEAVEGYVVDIGWRSTRVRMLQNTVVVVPNKKVAESVIVNYDLPEPRLALLRSHAGGGGDPRPPQRAGAVRALHPGLRRLLARLHADLPGRLVRGPVPGPARTAQAHPPPPPRRGDRDPVSDADGGDQGRAVVGVAGSVSLPRQAQSEAGGSARSGKGSALTGSSPAMRLLRT